MFLVLVTAGVVTLSAQPRRTFTNPRPEPYFKTLFPNAGGFSTFGGTPLHYKVYGVDPKTNPNAPPIGFIFWTTDVVPTDIGYFSGDPPKFVEQFKNKSIRDPFQVGKDIAAVSRASITINHSARVLREATRTMAKTFLRPEDLKQ